jgi:hypothetical protein
LGWRTNRRFELPSPLRNVRRFRDRDRRFGFFAPYEDYGYACDYSWGYWPGYYNGCVTPYQGGYGYGW